MTVSNLVKFSKPHFSHLSVGDTTVWLRVIIKIKYSYMWNIFHTGSVLRKPTKDICYCVLFQEITVPIICPHSLAFTEEVFQFPLQRGRNLPRSDETKIPIKLVIIQLDPCSQLLWKNSVTFLLSISLRFLLSPYAQCSKTHHAQGRTCRPWC